MDARVGDSDYAAVEVPHFCKVRLSNERCRTLDFSEKKQVGRATKQINAEFDFRDRNEERISHLMANAKAVRSRRPQAGASE